MAQPPRTRTRTKPPAPASEPAADIPATPAVPATRSRGRKPAQESSAPGAEMGLADLIPLANKAYGAHVMTSAAAFYQNSNVIPLGHLIGDLALLGGLPEGQSSMFIGNEGAGKTTQAMRAVANALHKYPNHKALWIDSEQTFDPAWAEHHGVPLDRLIIAQPVSGEDAVDLMKTACESAADLCIMVLDSVTTIIPMKEYNESVADIQVALHPRLMGRLASRMLASGSIRRRNGWVPVTKIFINQWRFKIGGLVLGDPRTIPGGRQFIHYCSSHLEFKAKVKTEKDAEEFDSTLSSEHTFIARRSKVAGSIRSGEYSVVISPDHGLPVGSYDEADTIVAFGKKIGLYQGAGTNQGFQGIGPRFRRMDEAAEWLEQNPDQALEIKRAIIMHRRQRAGLPPVPPDGFLLRW